MMDSTSSLRILLLGVRDSGTLDVIKDLTGSAPQPDVNGSTAGLTHEWEAQTAYYSAKIPIWIDELSDVETWKTEFMKDEAKEVVEAIGAWIYCFQPQKDGSVSQEAEETMKSIQEVVETHSYGSNAVLLAVSRPARNAVKADTEQPGQEEQEDICMQYGFEFVDYTATGRNEFGEKRGFERVKEALEANGWAAATDENGLDLDDLELDLNDELGGFDREEAEMTAELFGMKTALRTQGGEDDFDQSMDEADQVDDLDRMLGQLLAIKDQSANLPQEQRRKMAAQAVKDVMRKSADV